MSRDELIAAFKEKAAADPQVLALLLGGSLGARSGDAYSDVDLILVVASEDHSAFVEQVEAWVAQVAAPVLWRRTYPGLPLFLGITPEWVRFDITVTVQGRVTGARSGVAPLVDRAGVWNDLPERLDPRPVDLARLEAMVTEFLRVAGLLVLALGRQEYVLGITGLGLLRGLLIELMVAETEPPLQPGALHLRDILPEADMESLAALPSPAPDRASLIAANLILAGLFLPRARALAHKVGAAWPEAFEAATRDYWRRELGLALPAG
ncbi:hypothetical protein M9M90_17475 [Phenylobacterium sp. LH3H17]|uniref:hypothetical protein n=1 Tax=Phenylobacterium sp. LH3H17 TaxID=2903901 RepID=UPI0020C9CB24|nr:hypothetical protein [Phenylobacterium sp. LH3H17]UTP38993.1 hypothetical protein M9M90_17475 [Phenylobacterium sp. LH3H17]